jgi:AraC family transcriptional activator of tynA and feaB
VAAIALPAPANVAALLNLESVEESQRAAAWSRSVKTVFPGLAVRDLDVPTPLGSISGAPFGPGRLWTVVSPPIRVSYDPAANSNEGTQIFSVMMQLDGTTVAHQRQRRCLLRPGDFCVIDSRAPFDLDVATSGSHVMFLQMPRHSVLGRHPYLEQRTAEAFDSHDSGAMLLRTLLLGILESAHLLEEEQQAASLAAVIQMLGAAKLSYAPHELSWRVRAALACIDSQLSDTTLTAERVSRTQGISRRRLDEIMTKAVGISLTAQIWMRRLAQAAADLADPKYSKKTVSEIAYYAGFEDAAHFTRAFKRRYQCTPREWRNGLRVAPSHATTAAPKPS